MFFVLFYCSTYLQPPPPRMAGQAAPLPISCSRDKQGDAGRSSSVHCGSHKHLEPGITFSRRGTRRVSRGRENNNEERCPVPLPYYTVGDCSMTPWGNLVGQLKLKLSVGSAKLLGSGKVNLHWLELFLFSTKPKCYSQSGSKSASYHHLFVSCSLTLGVMHLCMIKYIIM